MISPQRLDLQIECNRCTPTRKSLDTWPPLPISIYCYPWGSEGARGNHNIFAALQQCNCISQIDFLDITCTEVEQFFAAMDELFPVLTDLCVHKFKLDMEPPVTAELPDLFLGGSAPRLQSFVLEGIAFPALLNLILSASHFQYLHLHTIPHAGYIPPEVMVTFLLPLHNLKGLTIRFSDFKSRPHQMNPSPLKHALLPSLTEFEFYGTSEYLLDFITQIDTPMLNNFQVTHTWEFTPNISQFHKFISHTDGLKPLIQAELYFCS